MEKFVFIFGAILIVPILSIPHHSLVVRSTEAEKTESEKEGQIHTSGVPQIYQMTIKSTITNRFARTNVTSKVRNFADKAQEAVFSIILPESAFISGFIMEVDGKNYTAYVKEKEEAKRTYDAAVSSGLSAAHVAVSARDSNRFTVNVNIEPQKKAAFYLTYEQLLNRQGGHYEQVINIHPGQPVKDLDVEVLVAESRKIVNLKAPPLRSGNEIGVENAELDPRADIEVINDTTASVKFRPNVERQKQLAHVFGNKEEDGLAGQFVVQYDVERDPQGGEVLIQDGYFVHFFAPTEIKPLPKQVIFILDTSGSMWGQKIEQLKQAMIKILEQLDEHDSFNLIEFNSNTRVWDINNHSASVWFPRTNSWYLDNENTFLILENASFPRAYSANADNIQKARKAVEAMHSDGSTNMYTALEVGLHLVEVERLDKSIEVKRQPIVIFLTDGDPTDYSTETITTKTTEFNSGPRKAPIFALSFGAGADKKFLEKLALRNSGFSRHIYDAADASLQLQDFYKQISSPLLSDVKFKYEPSVTSLTKTEYPIHFGGSEIVIAGVCGKIMPTPIINGNGKFGNISFKPAMVTKSISSIERLWAYLTISQLLEKKELSEEEKKATEKKALDLALKYSFVTSVSSLVVVKPNDTKPIDAVEATSSTGNHNRMGYYSAPAFAPGLPGPPGIPGIALAASSVHSFPLSTRHKLHSYPRPTIINTTPFTPTSTTKNSLDLLFEALPWLKDIVTNGFVTITSGTYKLGLNETISDNITCPKTPANQEGHCSLLHECPEVHSMLPSLTNFVDHFCVLRNEYAGVCCPNP